MAEFRRAFERTMGHEGDYVNDRQDPGGETYRGISRRYNPGWSGWAVIDRAKGHSGFPRSLARNAALQAAVAAFYKQHYWDKFWGDNVPQQAVAEELFDTAVNLGTQRAVEFLQKALNVLNRNEKLYKDLVVDGLFGPKSLAAIKIYLKKDKPDSLLKILNILQGMHYINIMNHSRTLEKFARGWFKRVDFQVQ